MTLFGYLKNFRRRRMLARKGLLNRSRRVNRGRSFLHRFFEHSPFSGAIVLTILLIVSVWSMMNPGNIAEVPRMIERQTANFSVYAAFPFSYEDRSKTAELRAAAEGSVPKFYRVPAEKTEEIEKILDEARAESEKRSQSRSGVYGYDPSDSLAGKYVRSLSEPEFEVFARVARDSKLYGLFSEKIREAVYRGLIDGPEKEALPWTTRLKIIDPHDRILSETRMIRDVPSAHEASVRIAGEIAVQHVAKNERQLFSERLGSAAESLLSGVCMGYDRPFTEEARKKALDAVEPAVCEIPKGRPLIRKNEIVTAQAVDLLSAYSGELKRMREESEVRFDWVLFLQDSAVALMLILFTAIYIAHIHPEVVASNRKIWFLGTVAALAVVLNVFATKVFAYTSELFSIPPWLLFLALPIGFAPLVVTMMSGVRSALYSGLFIALVASFSEADSFNTIVSGLVVSAVSAYLVRPCRNYRSFTLTGFASVSCFTLVMGVILAWRDGALSNASPWIFLLPFAVGIVTVVIAQIAIFVMEYFFDSTTAMSLLLYSDFNHPLLKRLQIEAPGTYHHSLVVAMLAEAAAEQIGADPVRARVCSLFHDVGKLSHPEYFTENSNGEDKHKDLNPKFSAMIIINHVKEGMELARQYKLKRPMRDAIRQHHGTDLVYFFYKRAKDAGECIDEHDFRYPGPLPHSKEIAILSLADACEAASRSLEKPTHGKISELVSEIVLKRLRTGQLDDAGITFRELTLVRESFVKTLTSMLHARIAYPKDEETQDENDLFVAAARKTAPAQDA